MRTIRPAVTDGVTPVCGERRRPWRDWLLSLVTLGVFAAVRHHRINRELSDYGIEVDPTRALLAFFPGGLLVVPLLVTVYRTAQRIAVAQETADLEPTIQPELASLASLFGFLHLPYVQTELNRVWVDHVEVRP